MVKKILKIACSVVIACLLEILVFNFSALAAQLRGLEPLLLQGNDWNYLNWDVTDDGARISLPDPVIYKEHLCTEVDKLTVVIEAQPQPAAYTVFYTAKEGESFSADKMILVEAGQGEVKIPIRGRVESLRIDPGEEAGMMLRDITLHINEFPWDISLSRMIAMLVIFWGTAWLMRLQSPPDYGIKMEEAEKDEA